ncbi:MAG: response regulator transcription factor [Bacteroidia bacterium]
MSPARILIVEDEPKVALFIKEGLEENQFGAEIAYDGLTGKQMALNGNFDAVILDVNLPVMNGLEVCREIRKMNLTVPVLMLTALGTTEDKLNGFDNGSDDYLVKPFEFRELLARIKVMLKRSQQNTAHGHVLRIADLELNTETKTVKRNNIQIELTAKEFALLELLMVNKGKVISRAEIAEKIWEITFDTGTNVIDVYINFLRKKIDKNFSTKLIHTYIGMGYTLKEPD